VLSGRGCHGLDDLSIIQTVEIPFDQQGGDLQRFDAELDDLADLSCDRLQSRQRLGPNRHQALESPLRVSRAPATNGSLEPPAYLFGHLESTEITCSRPDLSRDLRPEIPGEPSVRYLRPGHF
jgi:hypothetical protein